MKRRVLVLVLILATLIPLSTTGFAQEQVDISIRCRANEAAGELWRCNNFLDVEQQVEEAYGVDIVLELIQDNEEWGPYKNSFVLASEAGEAVDIILSGHEDVGTWSQSGIIIPLDDLIAEHAEFDDMVPSLWNSVTYDGQIWGVPQDAEARPIFFSKPLLSDLGWTDEEIESLPARIESGEFTFSDMIDVATEAVDTGVVEEGKGFWHRPTNGTDFLYFYYGMGGEILDDEGHLVFDTDAALRAYQALEDAYSSGAMNGSHLGLAWPDWHTIIGPADQVLFWAGGSYMWPEWANGYVADRGGQDYLFENVGYALMPALSTGVPLEISHPLAYMVSSSAERPDIAVALIAAITTPEFNNRHALQSGHLGILTTQLETAEYQADRLTSDIHPMLDYARFAPNHPGFGSWSEAFFMGIQAVETGELSAQAAVDTVQAQIANELGDNVVIR
ncbi:MAG: extracellular solute-binding protein [Anaerolineales bacterium]|nr:extracellular solute-binding protein [Anaerolineales bacterium]